MRGVPSPARIASVITNPACVCACVCVSASICECACVCMPGISVDFSPQDDCACTYLGARSGGGLQPDVAARPLDRTRIMRSRSGVFNQGSVLNNSGGDSPVHILLDVCVHIAVFVKNEMRRTSTCVHGCKHVHVHPRV